MNRYLPDAEPNLDHGRTWAPVIDVRHSTQLDITVILCTYNRCADLSGALESIANSQMAASVSWEVLVVDNNSSDQTRQIVESFGEKYPQRFRYLFEPTPGKSYALNAGIANARGEILAFVDDDVTVEPKWLHHLTAELLRDPSWAGTGGRTLPTGNFEVPIWLAPRSLPIVYPHFDLGDQPGSLSYPPYGTNMAFRRKVFEKYGGFRLDLGPRPGSLIRSEDTELGRRLMAAGERLRYEPSAVVYHPVPPNRVTQAHCFSWWFDYGRAMIKERGDRPDLYGISWDFLAVVRRFIDISALSLLATFAASPSKRFDYKSQVWKNKGQIAELRRRSVQGRPRKCNGLDASGAS